jgi:hypothetical protein
MVTQLPVRLVREDGDTIELLAHKVEFVVDRTSSAITTPFTDGAKFGIELNMAAVMLELEGTFVDDKGQEKSEFATATMDFGTEVPFADPPGNGQPDIFSSSSGTESGFARFADIGFTLPTMPPTTPSSEHIVYLNQLHAAGIFASSLIAGVVARSKNRMRTSIASGRRTFSLTVTTVQLAPSP